jgi:alkylation response protein AidB-like acyl-CoA dehydrogenase
VDRAHLDWPFFAAEQRELAEGLDGWCGGPPMTGHTAEPDVDAACRRLVRALGDGGWLRYCVPAAHGGALPALDSRALCVARERLAYHDGLADFAFAMQGLGSGAITLAGTAAQRDRWLPSVARGEAIAAFALSEPGAGSDVAALSTRAVRDGDHWVVNGQKVWSSYSDRADFGLLMARTDPSQPKHRGISYFLLDMHAPGVEVRPLRQLNGHSEFGEVFFTDVVVPDGDRLGPEGLGWSVAISTLMQERSGLSGRPGVGPGQADALAVRARRTGAWDDPVLRDRIMQAFITERVLQMATVRAFASLGRSEPGAEGSIRKLTHAQLEVTLGLLATEAEPGDAIAWDAPDQAAAAAVDAFLSGKILSIAGGTSEIQRNIIGERVLGLPRDRDPYADTPFEERPNG